METGGDSAADGKLKTPLRGRVGCDDSEHVETQSIVVEFPGWTRVEVTRVGPDMENKS